MRELVFWTLFAVVMLGIVVTLAQNYRRARARELEMEALHAKVLADAAAAKAALAKAAADGAAATFPPNDPVAPRQSAGEAGSASAPTTAPEVPDAESFDPAKTRLFVRADSVASLAGVPGGIPALVGLGGRHKGKRFLIPALGLTVGRADDNDVIIIDGRVSAHHAWIGLVDGRPMLRDYQSLNGTFLNAKLDVGVSEAALGNGDLVQFGGGGDQYQFVVH